VGACLFRDADWVAINAFQVATDEPVSSTEAGSFRHLEISFSDRWGDIVPLVDGIGEGLPLSLNGRRTAAARRTRPPPRTRDATVNIKVNDSLKAADDVHVGQDFKDCHGYAVGVP